MWIQPPVTGSRETSLHRSHWRTWLEGKDLGSFRGTWVHDRLLRILQPFDPQSELPPKQADLLLDRLMENQEKWGLSALSPDHATRPEDADVLHAYCSNLFFSGQAPELHQRLYDALRDGQSVPLEIRPRPVQAEVLAAGFLSKYKRIRFSAFHFSDPIRQRKTVRKFVFLPDPVDAPRFALASVHSAESLLSLAFPFMVGHALVEERPDHAIITELQSNLDLNKAMQSPLSEREPLLPQKRMNSYYVWAQRLFKPMIERYRESGKTILFPTAEAYALLHPNASTHSHALQRIPDEIARLSEKMDFKTAPLSSEETRSLNLNGPWKKIVFERG